jgi:hypothetical protein
METASNKVHLALDIELVQQLLSLLSLEQMELISAFLQQKIHQKMAADQSEKASTYKEPAFTIDMIEIWEEEVVIEEEEEEVDEEEFNRLVQEMS